MGIVFRMPTASERESFRRQIGEMRGELLGWRWVFSDRWNTKHVHGSGLNKGEKRDCVCKSMCRLWSPVKYTKQA